MRYLLGVVALAATLCVVEPVEGQILQRLFGGKPEPQQQINMNDVIRLQYYMSHIEAVNSIAAKTEGVSDEIRNLNDDVSDTLRKMHEVMAKDLQSRMMQQFAEAYEAGKPVPPVTLPTMQMMPQQQQQPTIINVIPSQPQTQYVPQYMPQYTPQRQMQQVLPQPMAELPPGWLRPQWFPPTPANSCGPGQNCPTGGCPTQGQSFRQQ